MVHESLESTEKNSLYTAFSQAQVEFPTIRVNRKAFKNEYADLYAILKPVYPILSKHGLSIRPWAGEINGEQWIGARLMHKSGQYETNVYRFEADPCKNPNDQPSHKKQGALTYFNRNHIKDMLGVLISDDPEDDDGQGHYHKEDTSKAPYHKIETLSPDQLLFINQVLEGHPNTCIKMKEVYNIENLADLPKHLFKEAVDKCQRHIEINKAIK